MPHSGSAHPTSYSHVTPAIATAVVVGTVLTLSNQWPALRAGRWTGELIWNIAVNLAVPFCVSLYSRWSATRAAPTSAPETSSTR